MFVTPRWLYSSGGELIYRFELDYEMSNRNDGRGHSFHRTAKERKAIELALTTQVELKRASNIIWPLRQDVVLVVTRVIPQGGRYWDEDSIGRGNAKELIDALVATEFLQDDSQTWVRHVVWNQQGQSRPTRGKTQVQFWTGDSYSEVYR